MTNNTNSIFDSIESGSFNSEEAAEIDVKLSKVSALEVPEHQIKSMMDYINFRLLQEAVPLHAREELEFLYMNLSKRHFDI